MPGELGAVEECDQDAAAGGVGESLADAGEGGFTGLTGQHELNYKAIHDVAASVVAGLLYTSASPTIAFVT
ncbi:hypothetical protein GCM10017691_61080 [Pseudonocardia petroleophila]